MKIAIISDRVYPYFKGGGEKRYWEIAKRLVFLGHTVHFYTGQWPGMKKDEKVDGIYLHGVYKVKNFYVNGRRSTKEAIMYSIKLFYPLMKTDFDIMDCEQFPFFSMFIAKIVCQLKGKKLIGTWHEAWGKEYWKKYLGWKGIFGYWTERLASRMADNIIAVSNMTATGLVKKLGADKEKISVINNGIDINSISMVKPSKEKSDIIYAGRLLDHKNVDILIKSVALIKKPVKCIIIGDGPERRKLEKLSKSLNTTNKVIFKGFLKKEEEIYSLMKSSKVFVLPSSREGFGITVLEANACGIPVVTVNEKDNAAKALIKNGVNGYVCKLDEKEIEKNIWNSLRFHKLSKNHKKYDWPSIVDHVLRVYQT